MSRALLAAALAALVALPPAACGKKGDLEAPPGADPAFPRQYPAPDTVVPEDDAEAAG